MRPITERVPRPLGLAKRAPGIWLDECVAGALYAKVKESGRTARWSAYLEGRIVTQMGTLAEAVAYVRKHARGAREGRGGCGDV